MPGKQFEQSDATARLVAYLRQLEKGAQITYAELSRLVGRKIVAKRVAYVRFILQRDANAVWVCVRPGVGLRRLTDEEIAERLPTFWLSGARRKLARGGTQADTVEIEKLDLDQQARFAVDCIQREVALQALSTASRRKMEKVARGTSNDLPAFNAVEWAITLSPRGRTTMKG